jgi:hypothetical protein
MASLLAENDIVLIRATVREAFPEEACVRLDVGTKGLTQSVWVARTAIVQVVPKQADAAAAGCEGDGRSGRRRVVQPRDQGRRG